MYERAIDFLREVKAELTKVNWPSQSELTGSTTVVIVLTIILAVFVGFIDLILRAFLGTT